MTIPNAYKVSVQDASITEVETLWGSLEPFSNANFFISWCWVSVWLATFKPNFKLLTVYLDAELVALSLLVCTAEKRHYNLVHSNVLRLGQTGDPDKDQIWIEYNDLLIHQAHIDSIPSAVVEYLLSESWWDEFEIGASDQSRLAQYQHPALVAVEKWSAPSYGVNLDMVRDSHDSYLASLSRNTRYQINRSRKLYEASGKLQFCVHKNEAAMMQLWPKLADFHQDRWGDQQGQSGFVNPFFVAFHKALIVAGANTDYVEFCTLEADGELLGCLYNFIYRGRVYFYLSGLKFHDDSRYKPGLLIHAMAIQHYMDQGMAYYDFMGGAARYKKSLGKQSIMLQTLSLQRNRSQLRFEQQLRSIKNKATTITHKLKQKAAKLK